MFNVTGGGSFCSGPGVSVGLSGSQTGVNYQLIRDNFTSVGAALAGTGLALDFGNQTTSGAYTVKATNATSGCESNMNGSATVTAGSAPDAFNVIGGGNYCGVSNVSIGLAASQVGINYQLVRNGNTSVGSPVSGSGLAIDFGSQIIGVYTVIATHATTGCTNTMTGSATITGGILPTAFNVTGGGYYCGATGTAVGLSGSQTGVNYQLMRNGATPVGAVVAGTNAALAFGNQTVAGVYTVIATNATTACGNTMTGNANVQVGLPPTVFNLTGGGNYCGATGVAVGLSGSQTLVDYQLMKDGSTPVGSAVAGTNAAISFGNQLLGTYTVVATSAITGCTIDMAANAIVTGGPLPTAFSVTGGGNYCSGPGLAIGLSGSQAGVNYQLVRNGSTNVGSPVAGTNAAISFGNQTVGVYTVVATNASTSCTNNMTGNAAVIDILPGLFTVTVSGTGYVCASSVHLSGSQTGVNYQLKVGASNVGSPVAGTGSAINFGSQTVQGYYTVVATSQVGACSRTMTGAPTITGANLPTVYNMTGGGLFCSGPGVPVGLSGSQTGVSYQLVRNGSTNVGSPVAGTNTTISFGTQNVLGTYTVVATKSDHGLCQQYERYLDGYKWNIAHCI